MIPCAVCRKPTDRGRCPLCSAVVCSEPCFNEHAVPHVMAATGATAEEARLAMVGSIDSVEEREAVAQFEARQKGERS